MSFDIRKIVRPHIVNLKPYSSARDEFDESAGDYASGTNHTLPTNGYAKQYSGVNLDSFLKAITFQKISPTGLKDLGPAIETLADAEGLFAHKNAVSLRLKDLS